MIPLPLSWEHGPPGPYLPQHSEVPTGSHRAVCRYMPTPMRILRAVSPHRQEYVSSFMPSLTHSRRRRVLSSDFGKALGRALGIWSNSDSDPALKELPAKHGEVDIRGRRVLG